MGYSQTISDNIFSILISKEAIFGKLTSTISGHLSQVLFTPLM